MHRILLAGLFHEGNSFTTQVTPAERFTVTAGDAVLSKAETSGAGLGGAYRHLRQHGAELIPFRTATASPGAPVVDDFYFRFRDELLQAVTTAAPDGVYVELHGAMLTQSLDDPEGDLLAQLRDRVGPDIVIAVNLDLHAYVTERMLRNADIIVACKENPHSDFHLAGERAASLMLQKLSRQIAPVTAAVWAPLFIATQMETASGPLKHVHARRQQLLTQHRGVLDISIYNTQTLLDVARGGQCVTVITDNDNATALKIAQILARELWERRDEFTPDKPALDRVLDDLEDGTLARPVILGDGGDNALAGTAGDATAILDELITRRASLRVAIPITDPEIVTLAKSMGTGATLSACVGGRLTRGVNPVCGDWDVLRIGDGNFVQQGPFLANEPANLGDTAVLRRGNVTLLVTSRPGFTQDVQAFRSNGIEPTDFDAVVVKSNYHYKLSFAGIGPCITVDTPSLTNIKPGSLPFVKRRPIYPEDQMSEADFIELVV